MYQSALTQDETLEGAYLRECGERGAETVAETILDQAPGCIRGADKERLRVVLMAALAGMEALTVDEQVTLIAALAGMEPLTVGEWAAYCVGNRSYEEWRDDLEEGL